MNILSRFSRIRAFVFDVDGVLTDGTLVLLDDGQQARTMHIRDGYALQLAVKKGYHVMVISGASSEAVEKRLAKLGVKEVHMGITDKSSLLQKYLQHHALGAEEVLFMGDDMPDLEAMSLAGLPCCPSDAAPEIRELAAYISPIAGGKGCVRDVIEKTLKINGHWTTEDRIAAR